MATVREIIARKKFLKKIKQLADSLLTTGKVVREVANGYHHYKLCKTTFEGFFFEEETCQSPLGGNYLKIWYNPTRKLTTRGELVFVIVWQPFVLDPDDKATQVEFFSHKLDWEVAIIALEKNETRLLAKWQRARTSTEVRKQGPSENERKLQVNAEARRLGL